MSTPRNVGEALLLRLRQLGVSYFFANPGTEFISVIRGFRDLPVAEVPEPIMAPHEFQAVSMAYGAYLATGRPQAVMTHASVGAANALIGLIGAARMRVPLIFLSGATAANERGDKGCRNKLIHWAQEEASPAYREHVKWETEVRDPSSLYDLLDRAYAIAMTEPRGPVALRLSRDILVRTDCPSAPARISAHPATPAAPSPQELAELLSRLAAAERPLLVTNRLGEQPGAISTLVRAAERHAFGVLTPDDYYQSFPPDHPQHLGFRQSAVLTEADLVIALETDAPWFPVGSGPVENAYVAQVGAEPLFPEYGLRSHRGDLFLRASPALFVDALAAAPGPSTDLLTHRRSWLNRARKPRPASSDKLDAGAVSTALGECLGENCILVNELGLDPERLGNLRPGTYFRSGAASPLGWGVGCALGAALANPGRTAVVAAGDGVALLAPLLGALATAAGQKIPFVLLVLDNGGYRSVARTVSEFYPTSSLDLPLTRFPEGLRFDRCAEFAGGFGATAHTPTELRAVLREALAFTGRERRPAVVHVVLEEG